MPFDEYTRQRFGILTPSERSAKNHNDEAAAYYKEQRQLIADQKFYTAAIKRSSNVTAWATAVMAGATIIIMVTTISQCNAFNSSKVEKSTQIQQQSDSLKMGQQKVP